MLGGKRKAEPSEMTEWLVGDAPATYADAGQFPGVVHIGRMERISRVVHASTAPQRERMAEHVALLQTLVCRPQAVELTPQVMVSLGDGRRWLEANHLDSEARDYTAILRDLARYWDRSGAMRRYRDSLK